MDPECDIARLRIWRRRHTLCTDYGTFEIVTTSSAHYAYACRKHIGAIVAHALSDYTLTAVRYTSLPITPAPQAS